jgi:hypothetical protein
MSIFHIIDFKKKIMDTGILDFFKSNKEVCISIPADDLNNVVLVKGTDIWEDRISISLLAEFDIIS